MDLMRPALRIHVVAVVAAAVALLILTAQLPDLPQLARVFLLAGVAAVAQLRPIHLSANIKVTTEDAATFAAALSLGPFLGALVAGSSTLVALRTAPGEPFGLRVFNAATSVLGTGCCAIVFQALSARGSMVDWAVGATAAGATKYLLETALVDTAVGLQLRRNPLVTWWRIHRRDILPHAALYLLGVVGALLMAESPWAVVLFVAPVALVLLSLQQSARLRERTQHGVLELADIVDARDPYTRDHSKRTADMAERLARRLGLDPAQVELVRLAARVHDIGKVGTNDHVLLKPGPLDSDEESEMRRHAEIGARLLSQFPEFWEGAAIVLAHHERPDGTGYPRGLKGSELPFEAAVVAVADAHDAMTNDRPYRKALSWPAARAELLQHRGTQWDARVIDAFIAMLDEETALIATDQSRVTNIGTVKDPASR